MRVVKRPGKIYLLVELRGRERDARVDHAIHPEGAQRPRAVVEVDDVGIVLVMILHGIDLVAGAEGTDDARVAGCHAFGHGAVSLAVGDADPPGVERGAEEDTVVRVAVTVSEGKEDRESGVGGAGHASMVPCPAGLSRGWKKEIFLCGRVDGVGCRGIIGA